MTDVQKLKWWFALTGGVLMLYTGGMLFGATGVAGALGLWLMMAACS